jgi:hypothetical protein
MIKKSGIHPLLGKALKALLIVTTALTSGIATAASDPMPDETAQINASGSSVEARSESRRIVAVASTQTAQQLEPGVPPGLSGDDHAEAVEGVESFLPDMTLHSSHTAYGAGSFAMSALGANASIFLGHST